MEQIERWAKYIKDNPETWREQHTRFLNDQFEMANAALKRIEAMPGGKEKIAKLKTIKSSRR